jgi:hypothetical protein
MISTEVSSLAAHNSGVDESRRGDDGGGGRGGRGVLDPNGGDDDVREVDECRFWDDGGGRGGGGGRSVAGSTGVEAGTVEAAGAVNCMLTRALTT